jgi:chromatin modification-related protein VID21
MQANFANGNMSGMPMGTPGVPQAQMQSSMQNSQRMGPPDQMRMAMQRNQFQNPNQQQQQQQFHLQQQQMNMAGNLPQGMNMNNMPNANMMASMSNQNMNGNMSNNMNGMSHTAGSPRPNQAIPARQSPVGPLPSGHMPQFVNLQNSIKTQHPDWTADQVTKVASEQFSRLLAKQRSQAMNAAAGSPGISPSPQMGGNHFVPNGTTANSPPVNAIQTYQHNLQQQQRMLSQSQRQQAQQAGSPSSSARPPSRSATPQNPQQVQQSPGLQQAQVNRP